MVVIFRSVDQENNSVSFQSEGYYDGEYLIFEDKSALETKIHLQILDNKLILIREGLIKMKITLVEGKCLPSYYKNDIGLEFNFIAFCKKLIINKNKIMVEYDMILDNEKLSSHKIWIILH